MRRGPISGPGWRRSARTTPGSTAIHSSSVRSARICTTRSSSTPSGSTCMSGTRCGWPADTVPMPAGRRLGGGPVTSGAGLAGRLPTIAASRKGLRLLVVHTSPRGWLDPPAGARQWRTCRSRLVRHPAFRDGTENDARHRPAGRADPSSGDRRSDGTASVEPAVPPCPQGSPAELIRGVRRVPDGATAAPQPSRRCRAAPRA